MKAYRRMAMAVTTCAAGLSLAACTAGVTTASPSTSRSLATSRTASSPAAAASSASPAPTGSAGTISVDAPIGSFPIPPAAQVLFNSTCDKQIVIELGSVTPAQASSFYTAALPQAGYKITSNSLLAETGTGLPGSVATIEFTGRGYKGTISALANLGALSSTGPSPAPVPSSIAKNFLAIELTPPGAAECDGSAGP
jgi:hypothetical protein